LTENQGVSWCKDEVFVRGEMMNEKMSKKRKEISATYQHNREAYAKSAEEANSRSFLFFGSATYLYVYKYMYVPIDT
jgi:hypothetical protein